MERVVVLGSGGMLGHMMYLVLKQALPNHVVFGISRSEGPTVDAVTEHIGDLICGDDIVVNCIGVLNEACERDRERAVYLNSMLPHFVAKRCRFLFQISTDCVFLGDKYSIYKKTDVTDATSLYGRTKILGEITDRTNVVTMRQSIIGPSLDQYNRGLFNWLFRLSFDSIEGYTNHLWNGVTTQYLAKVIASIINEAAWPCGLVHLVPNEIWTKDDLIRYMLHIFEVKKQVTSVEKNRLNRSLEADSAWRVPSLVDQLEELKIHMQKYSELYPHYAPDYVDPELDSVAY